MSRVGLLRVCYSHDREVKIEWKIEDFLLYNTGITPHIMSPEFFFCGMSWYIEIYPNGTTGNGPLSIFIKTKSMITAPIIIAFRLHLKTADGVPDADAKCTDTQVFQRNDAYSCHEFISLSKLIERKSELLPEGTLTVICTLQEIDTNVEAAGNTTNDEFTRIQEGTDALKLLQHLKEIFRNGTFSDVVLKLDNQEFKCHRCVLARSPVFSAMMTHEMKEKNTSVVDIQEDNPNTFSDFLHYLYTGNKEIIKSESVVNLFTTADKYQVDELKKSCLDYMLKNISVDNFCDVLSLSLVHVERGLTDACSQFYIKNSLSIVITPKWLEFMMKHPVAANELYIKQLKNNNMEIKN